MNQKSEVSKIEIPLSTVNIVIESNAPFIDDNRRKGWKLEADVIEPTGNLTLELVSFLRPGDCPSKWSNITDRMIERAKEMKVNLGQRHAEAIQMLEENDRIPWDWREFAIAFPGTIWRTPDGRRKITTISWLRHGALVDQLTKLSYVCFLRPRR